MPSRFMGEWLEDRRVVVAAVCAGVVLVVGGGGLAAASAMSHPERASAGRVVSFDYDTVRAPRYTPPPPSEATRLDVRPPESLYQHVEVLSPEADATWRDMQADDASRMAAALAEVRASDRRLDRELASQLRETRYRPAWAGRDEPAADFVLDDDEGDDVADETQG